jgi:dGTP triphosphohydrolase
MNLRHQLEARELETLAAQAAKSVASRGRLRSEAEDEVRPAFQRDRDRIVHCKAFRRLKHKTQVFFAPTGDHYRTRLTHTLEVSQIARTIAKVLRLHEELTEAIALGHDLGHTPFGHAGERVIDRLMPGGFNHYEQSLRIVDVLENEGRGLNLTWEVRDGIAKHSKGKSGAPIGMDSALRSSTMEGQIMRVADLIAYVNHDIDDATRAGPGIGASAAKLSLRCGVRECHRNRRVQEGGGDSQRSLGEGARASRRLSRSTDDRARGPGRRGSRLHRRHDRPLRRSAVRGVVRSQTLGRRVVRR